MNHAHLSFTSKARRHGGSRTRDETLDLVVCKSCVQATLLFRELRQELQISSPNAATNTKHRQSNSRKCETLLARVADLLGIVTCMLPTERATTKLGDLGDFEPDAESLLISRCRQFHVDGEAPQERAANLSFVTVRS